MPAYEGVELQNAFNILDRDRKTFIDKNDLLKQYCKMHSKNQSSEIVNEIFNTIDKDKSGKIDFDEFIIATVDRNKLLSHDNMIKAFKIFDNDGGGTISTDEIKDTLFYGKNID